MDHRIKNIASEMMRSLGVRYENECPGVIRLAYRNRPLDPQEIVRDVRGNIIREGWRPSLGVLLVFDPWPYANWGHECWVAGLDAARDIGTDDWSAEHLFPPEEDDASHFVPCATYEKNGKLNWYYPLERSPESSPAG
ncbi:MAG: hypothetical protein ACLQVD_02470 [Capsulimonadaceae bacterium]|jgi:hypothetical protein